MKPNELTDQTTFVPLNLKRRAGRLITDTGAPAHDVNILNVVGRGFFWQDLLDTDVYYSGSDIAKVEGVTPSTVNRLVRMGLLAPDLIEELMAGKQPRRLTAHWLIRNRIPCLWSEQRAVFERFR
jgi:hypothetical protein